MSIPMNEEKYPFPPANPCCGYQGYEFGGPYLSSVCIEGRLRDLNFCSETGVLHEPDEDIPCPICHEIEAGHYWIKRLAYSHLAPDVILDRVMRFIETIRSNRGFDCLMDPPLENKHQTS